MKFNISFLLLVISIFISAQTGSINVNVFDEFSKKSLSAKILIPKVQQEFSGTGNVVISELPTGSYNLEVASQDYETGNNSTVKNVIQNTVDFDDILSEIRVFQYGMYGAEKKWIF